MSDSSNRAKPASVAAFLFLPQFGMMFRSSSHLIPVFIRTVSHLFVQAGLLPPTHPAAHYGEPGIEKCGFFRMMGDTWHNLRETAASPYQWSIFCSVLLMIFILVSTAVSMLISLSSTFVGSAAAQIFTLQGGGGGGQLETDIAGMPGPQNPCTTQTPLCRIIPDQGTGYGDYAIDMLDKILRLGANQTGGPLQNATGALMQVYNSGILFVAACLLFWLVISIVVDIAKTGQVGGGRHNLVWAPIRIVFALGMMVPLGPSGFSSGQFVIMKIAEWGSNFGSNGWNAYLKSVNSGTNLIQSAPRGEDILPLAAAYEKMWICKVAHNGYGVLAEGDAFTMGDTSNNFSGNPNAYAQVVEIRADSSEQDNGQMSYAYTDATSNDLCGRVTFPTGNDPVLQGIIHPQFAGTAPNQVSIAEANFKIAVDKAWMGLFVAGYQGGPASSAYNPASASSMSDTMEIANKAKAFACGFVAQHIWGKGGANSNQDALYIDCGGGYNAPQCGSGPPGSSLYPNATSCIYDPNNERNTSTITGYIGDTILNTVTAQTATLQNLKTSDLFGSRGWADMATFYRNITTLSSTVNGSLAIPIQISAPGIGNSGDNQQEKVEEVLTKYDDWMNSVLNQTSAGVVNPACNQNPPPANANCSFAHHSPGLKERVANVAKTAQGTTGIGSIFQAGQSTGSNLTAMVSNIQNNPSQAMLKDAITLMKDFEGSSFLAIPDPNDPAHVNDYPLVILSNIGMTLINIAGGLYGAVTAMEIMAQANESFAIATTMMAQLVNTLGEILMTCGLLLTFYLPLLPFIRVSHAVLVWAIAVFEAVMLVPIACLSFLDTEKEGMYAKHPFICWLDILVRPILVVIGYIGGIIVFDAFFGYVQSAYANATSAEVADTNVEFHLIAMVVNSVIFIFMMYTAANTCFKMITMIPDAFFRWLPGSTASGATSLVGEGPNVSGAVSKMGSTMNTVGNAPAQAIQQMRYSGSGNPNNPMNPGNPSATKPPSS